MEFNTLFKKIHYNSNVVESYFKKLKELESGNVSFCVHQSTEKFIFSNVLSNFKKRVELINSLFEDCGGISNSLMWNKYSIWYNDEVNIEFYDFNKEKIILSFYSEFEEASKEIINSVQELFENQNKDIYCRIKLVKKSSERVNFESFLNDGKLDDYYLSMIVNYIADHEKLKQKSEFKFDPSTLPNKVKYNSFFKDFDSFLKNNIHTFSPSTKNLVDKFYETYDLSFLVLIYSNSGWDNSNFHYLS